MRNKRFPKYPDDTDYTTNSPSYYDDLARKQKLIQLLAEKIWEYDERLDERLEDLENVLQDYLSQWDERIENLDDEVSHIFVTWLNDGTLEQIINHDVLGNKADKSFVDAEIERLDQKDENLTTIKADKTFVDSEIERLDQKDDSITTELENKMLAMEQYVDDEIAENKRVVKYGNVTLPNDFNFPDNVITPLKLTRDLDGKLSHNVQLDTLNRHVQVVIYVDTINGKNISGDGTKENPYGTLGRAMQSVISSSQKRFKIIVSGDFLLLGEFSAGEDLDLSGKNLSIVTKDNKSIPAINGWTSSRGSMALASDTHSDGLNWTQYSGNVYTVTRTNSFTVIDLKQKNSYGGIAELFEATTDTECYNNPGSYFIDGDDVKVHTFDGRKPDKDVFIVAKYHLRSFNVKLTKSVFTIQNLKFFSNRGALVEGTIDSIFGMENFEIGRTQFFNGVSVIDVGLSYMFNGHVYGAERDGLNYKFSNLTPSELIKTYVFEDNIKSYNNGVRDDNVNNNCSTAHQGVNILRTNGLYSKSRGPVVNDVQGCYSILINCQSNDSILSTSRGNSYQFESSEDYRNAKVIMIDCGGSSPNKSIMVDEQTDLILEGWLEGSDTIAILD